MYETGGSIKESKKKFSFGRKSSRKNSDASSSEEFSFERTDSPPLSRKPSMKSLARADTWQELWTHIRGIPMGSDADIRETFTWAYRNVFGQDSTIPDTTLARLVAVHHVFKNEAEFENYKENVQSHFSKLTALDKTMMEIVDGPQNKLGGMRVDAIPASITQVFASDYDYVVFHEAVSTVEAMMGIFSDLKASQSDSITVMEAFYDLLQQNDAVKLFAALQTSYANVQTAVIQDKRMTEADKKDFLKLESVVIGAVQLFSAAIPPYKDVVEAAEKMQDFRLKPLQALGERCKQFATDFNTYMKITFPDNPARLTGENKRLLDSVFHGIKRFRQNGESAVDKITLCTNADALALLYLQRANRETSVDVVQKLTSDVIMFLDFSRKIDTAHCNAELTKVLASHLDTLDLKYPELSQDILFIQTQLMDRELSAYAAELKTKAENANAVLDTLTAPKKSLPPTPSAPSVSSGDPSPITSRKPLPAAPPEEVEHLSHGLRG